jgi:hypothetical protein
MSGVLPSNHQKIVALICVGDARAGDSGAVLPLTSVYGQPYIHHIIKSLQALGISKFIVGVDHVPGALLAYGDVAKQQGLDVTFAREPNALATQTDSDVNVLVLCADTHWSIELLQKAIAAQKPLIATVEERLENDAFERIDLNSRWAGMAVLDHKTLATMTALPDGWDMASSLLRQGLQDGAALWPVRQSDVQAGKIAKLRTVNDVMTALSQLLPTSDAEPKTLEQTVLRPLVSRFLPNIWSVSWGRTIIEWLSSGLGIGSAVLAGVATPIAAAIMATLAIISANIRVSVRLAEYRQKDNDTIGYFTWTVLVISLILLLYNTGERPLDAGFIGLSMSGIGLFASRYLKASQFWLSSPLMIAAVVLFGIIFDGAGWTIRLLILAQIAALTIAQFTPVTESAKTTD